MRKIKKLDIKKLNPDKRMDVMRWVDPMCGPIFR
jgi:hypothetical protein